MRVLLLLLLSTFSISADTIIKVTGTCPVTIVTPEPPVMPPVIPPTHPPVEPPIEPPIEPPVEPPIEPPVTPPTEPTGKIYYIANNGNDRNIGTKLKPWKTYQKAKRILASLGKDDAILFKRGDKFYATNNNRLTKVKASVGVYGSGERAIIKQTNSAPVFELNPGYNQPAQNGFRMYGLELQCTSRSKK